MSEASAAPLSCKEDAELARSLVLKPLKMRHSQLTQGQWISGHGVYKEEEISDEEVVHQISVLHADAFVRTYTVSAAEFIVIDDPDSVELDPQRTQCFVGKAGDKITKQKVEEGMNSRHFRGGCDEGKKLIAEIDDLNVMAGTRIQYWDTTQAAWFAGRIVGMWYDKPRTHFLCLFDDDTEYAVEAEKDVWRLEPGAAVVPFDQYKSGGFGRFLLTNNGKSEVLEFIVLTKAPRQRLQVCCSKYSIIVFKEHRADGTADDSEPSDDESEEVSDGVGRENNPAAEQVGPANEVKEGRKSRSKWWSASSDKPLNSAELKAEVITNDAGKPIALRVIAPVETGGKDRDTRKGASKPRPQRRPAKLDS